MACLDDEGGCVVNETANNPKTISEMISSLKSAFRSADFAKVEAVLVQREAKLKLEIEAKARENELLLQEKDLAEERSQYGKLECLRREREIEECKKECLRLKELNSHLCLKLKVCDERLANYASDKEVIIALKRENCELKCANLRMENEVELLRIKFEDWEARVSLLENDWVVLNGVNPSDSRSAKVSGGEDLRKRGVSEKVMSVKEIAKVKLEKEVLGEKNESCENVDDVKAVVGENVAVEARNGSPALRVMENADGCMGGSGSGRPVIQDDVVEIADSDDDSESCKILSVKETATVQVPMKDSCLRGAVDVTGTRVLKRKRASFVNISRNNSDQEVDEQTVEHKLPKLQEFTDGPCSSLVNNCLLKTQPSWSNDGGKVSMTSRKDQMDQTSKVVLDMLFKYDNEDSSSSSDSEDVDLSSDYSVLLEKRPANGEHIKWKTEGDMVSALGKDRELCLWAVCALYRQQSALGKSSGNSSTSRDRGFNKLDAVRGSTLAEFLIDGDPQGKLKKSVKELVAHDPKGLEDCKRLAMEHSKQLFEIYQSKGDPLFLN